VHEETQFVLDSLHDRKPMQLPKGRSYMVASFQVEHESRRRVQDSLQWCQYHRREVDEDGAALRVDMSRAAFFTCICMMRNQ